MRRHRIDDLPPDVAQYVAEALDAANVPALTRRIRAICWDCPARAADDDTPCASCPAHALIWTAAEATARALLHLHPEQAADIDDYHDAAGGVLSPPRDDVTARDNPPGAGGGGLEEKSRK